MKMDKNNSSLF